MGWGQRIGIFVFWESWFCVGVWGLTSGMLMGGGSDRGVLGQILGMLHDNS